MTKIIMKDCKNSDDRKNELLDYLNNNKVYIPLIEDIVYLENELDKLRKMQKIEIKGTKHRRTDASKVYKEYLQQYLNAIKLLSSSGNEEGEESPLEKWLKTKNEVQ